MAGTVELEIMSVDTGSYSVKSISRRSEGSFLSVAASVGLTALDGFQAFRMQIPNSYRLEILSTNDEGRFDYATRKAWVIGEAAKDESKPIYGQRDMRRFNSESYIPFIAAALRTSFPTARHDLEEVKKAGWLISKKWATPVHVFASIAPGYYSFAPRIQETLQGKYIAFVDAETKNVYVFRLEKVEVVPESFGSFQYCLYDIPPKGANGSAKRSKSADIIERATTCLIDFGGQTMDYMKWRSRGIVPNGYGTEEIGFNAYVEEIAKQVFYTYSDSFAVHPTRFDVLGAMRGNYGKKMIVVGIGGRKLDITDIVTAQMNRFASNIENVWRGDKLQSGQGIQILYLGGGAALDAYPYINDKLYHEKRSFVSPKKDSYEMYMANAIGTYLWGTMR